MDITRNDEQAIRSVYVDHQNTVFGIMFVVALISCVYVLRLTISSCYNSLGVMLYIAKQRNARRSGERSWVEKKYE